jgi:competence protein ComEC
LAVLLLGSLILAGIIFQAKNRELRIIFLDVGQGDAILLIQGKNQILIDGGPSEQILLEKLGRYVPFWDRKIETVIATHPDQDHIQGLVGVLKNYQVETLIESQVQNDSQLYKKYEELMAEKQIAKIKAEQGMNIKIGEADLEILHPEKETPAGVVKDANSYSVVLKMLVGNDSFLFMGDLPDEEELELIRKNFDLQARVLKVGHHGSKHSSAQEFLHKVHPQIAVLSVGKSNRFGHPAPEAMERLEKIQAKILRTDEQGDIEFICLSGQDECVLQN